MTALSDRVASKVAATLSPSKAGRSGIVLRTYLSRTSDDAAGTTTLGAPHDVELVSSDLIGYRKALVDGDLIQNGDCYVVCQAGGSNPKPKKDDLIVADGRQWKVVSVTTHALNAVDIAHEVQLRGSA